MCECLCGETRGDHVYEMNGRVLVVDEYPGCEGCNNGPGVSLLLLEKAEAADYIDNLPDVIPAMPELAVFTLFEVGDLVEAVRQMRDEINEEDYDFEGLLSDYGHALISRACRIKRTRDKGNRDANG